MEICFGISHRESRKKLYNVIINHLPSDLLDFLVKNNIILPSQIFSNRLIFEYINFLTCTSWINELLQLLINKKTMDYMHKRDLLECEIYEFVFSKCNHGLRCGSGSVVQLLVLIIVLKQRF
jgi:hypothetical protein